MTSDEEIYSKQPEEILPLSERTLIETNKMLSDISINLCQKIIKQQFQITLLGPVLQFKEENKFVQILHNGSFHWVAVSNIGCETDSINYYDSMFHGQIKHAIKNQNVRHSL